MKIVVLERDTMGYDIDLSELESLGDVTYYNNTDEDQIKERVKDAEILLVNKLPVNAKTIEGAKDLKLICVTATGVDNIDKSYTDEMGILVTNAAGYSTQCVAQHTFAMLFYLLEKISYFDQYVKSGEYCKSTTFTNLSHPFNELNGKTWGILGLGQIGSQVAEIAKIFGCRVYYYSTSGENESTECYKVGFDELLQEADVISIHAALTPDTENLLTLKEFKKMKNSVILLNLSRGAIINEADLVTALKDNVIAAAGLDVLAEEPMRPDHPFLDIQDSTRLLITPHIAWTSLESRSKLVDIVCENIKDYLDEKEIYTI